MTTTAAGELTTCGDLVDDDDRRFQVHTRAYGDPGIFDAEMRHIFERSWVYVGHASEIPDAGDYKTASLGIQPVIVSRHADGDIHVLFNRCTHRAAAVCREDIGHSTTSAARTTTGSSATTANWSASRMPAVTPTTSTSRNWASSGRGWPPTAG